MLNFCTLFHSNYAAQGLTLYRSLVRVCPDFHLYVFAFDDETVALLEEMALPHMTVIPLIEFEDPELLSVKPTRSVGEYCWTCTASTILHCLNHYDLDHCTYLDSDLYFFQNPQGMIDEIGSDDILITPHWFAPDNDNSEEVGKFCVQFVTVRNTPNALNIIKEWRNECIDWCFGHHENGKFGDQKYLDKWPVVHSGVHVSENMGGGVAPWNMERYLFRFEHGSLYATERNQGITFPVVFCHFHFIYTSSKAWLHKFSYDTYALDKNCLRLAFIHYCRELKRSFRVLKRLGYSNEVLGITAEKSPWPSVLRQWAKGIRRVDYTHYWWLG